MYRGRRTFFFKKGIGEQDFNSANFDESWIKCDTFSHILPLGFTMLMLNVWT